MTINMEVKKDGLRQTQDGLWKLTLTILPEDMPVDLMVAPMGSRYAMAIVPIRDDESANPVISKTETTEGEKLRTRAVMLCKEREFQIFLESLDKNMVVFNESHARDFICEYCHIKSRSELSTNIEAQRELKELLEMYRDWQTENQYADNLNRY